MIQPGMTKRKRSEHYVNNKEFLAALIEYRTLVEIAYRKKFGKNLSEQDKSERARRFDTKPHISSIVLMFPSRWFAPLGRTPSNLKSALRPVMVLLLTPSQKEPLQAQVVSVSTATATIVALLLRTLCDPLVTRLYKTPFGGSFFCI